MAKPKTAGAYSQAVFDSGVEQGREEYRKKALTYLEKKYMDPSLVAGSEYARAILEITRELSLALKEDK